MGIWSHDIRLLNLTVESLRSHFITIKVRPLNIPGRCDRMTLLDCLRNLFRHIPDQEWDEAFAAGQFTSRDVRDTGAVVAADRIVRAGERFFRQEEETQEPPVVDRLEILFEDETLIAVNKPAPLPMHPCGRYEKNTLLTLLRRRCAVTNWRLVNRLDANTTGVVLVAKGGESAAFLHHQFAEKSVEKRYLAEVHGHPSRDRFEVRTRLGEGAHKIRVPDPAGAEALTRVSVLNRDHDGSSGLELFPETGRTNQLRAHLWHTGHPIIGDPLYLPGGGLADRPRTLLPNEPMMRLHSERLTFCHPADRLRRTIQAPPPFG